MLTAYTVVPYGLLHGDKLFLTTSTPLTYHASKEPKSASRLDLMMRMYFKHNGSKFFFLKIARIRTMPYRTYKKLSALYIDDTGLRIVNNTQGIDNTK